MSGLTTTAQLVKSEQYQLALESLTQTETKQEKTFYWKSLLGIIFKLESQIVFIGRLYFWYALIGWLFI